MQRIGVSFGHLKGNSSAPCLAPTKAASRCLQCGVEFGFFSLKLNCLHCGLVFCSKCTTRKVALPEFGYKKRVHVCDLCALKLHVRRGEWDQVNTMPNKLLTQFSEKNNIDYSGCVERKDLLEQIRKAVDPSYNPSYSTSSSTPSSSSSSSPYTTSSSSPSARRHTEAAPPTTSTGTFNVFGNTENRNNISVPQQQQQRRHSATPTGTTTADFPSASSSTTSPSYYYYAPHNQNNTNSNAGGEQTNRRASYAVPQQHHTSSFEHRPEPAPSPHIFVSQHPISSSSSAAADIPQTNASFSSPSHSNNADDSPSTTSLRRPPSPYSSSPNYSRRNNNQQGEEEEEEEEEKTRKLTAEEEEYVASLPVRRLKQILIQQDCNFTDCVEKVDLINKVKQCMLSPGWKGKPLFRSKEDAASSVVHEPRSDEDSDMCKICYERPINCVFLECGHLMACMECGRKLKDCPLCRRYITRLVETFKG
ncbi:Apoptosis 2 inhibitor [Balamuthia mandrillaris]